MSVLQFFRDVFGTTIPDNDIIEEEEPNKNLTMQAVFTAATSIIREKIDNGDKGTVTTLEVKQKLREEGYYALQSDVSSFMNELTGEVFEFESGTYRTYYLKSEDTNSCEDDEDDDLNCWEVTSCNINCTEFELYDKNIYTRNQARYTFSKTHKTPYTDTRVKSKSFV